MNLNTTQGFFNMSKKHKHGFTNEQYNTIAQQIDAIGDKAWDDLERVYLECRALSVTPAQVLPLLRDPARIKQVEDVKSLTENAQVLSKDVMIYNQRLANIHSKHENKKGSATDPDELMTVLSIGEEYQDWLYSFQTVVMPSVGTVMQMFSTKAVEGEFIPASKGE